MRHEQLFTDDHLAFLHNLSWLSYFRILCTSHHHTLMIILLLSKIPKSSTRHRVRKRMYAGRLFNKYTSPPKHAWCRSPTADKNSPVVVISFSWQSFRQNRFPKRCGRAIAAAKTHPKNNPSTYCQNCVGRLCWLHHLSLDLTKLFGKLLALPEAPNAYKSLDCE